MSSPESNTIHRFHQFFRLESLGFQHRYLLAVSGGVDSVVLTDLFHRSNFSFSIAHCNFNLRGEESERDENFVRELSERYQAPFFIQQFNTNQYAEENKLSIQQAARELRYQWFRKLKEEKGFHFIVTAHHADDNIETLLMNFFRGTGLNGLTGIPYRTKDLLRPMLPFRKEELLAYAQQHNLQWVDDSSNESVKYTRNFFRHELIPAISKVFPQAEENLLQNIQRFRSIHDFYQEAVQAMLKKMIEKKGNTQQVPIRKLKKVHTELLLFEWLKHYGFQEKSIPEVLKLMESSSGHYMENADYQLIRHGNWLILAPRLLKMDHFIIEPEMTELIYGNAQIKLQRKDASSYKLQMDNSVAQLDARNIQFPLVLRQWKAGDYFYPLGMRKKKKVARFLIDQKLPKHDKENTWVIESNKKIIWVVGRRIDDRFKITSSTREVLLITNKHEAF